MLRASLPVNGTLLGVTVSRRDDRDTVCVSGEMDIASTPELHQVIDLLLADGRRDLVINLDGVTFMDATAIGELIDADLRARQLGGFLQVTSHTGCQRLLRLTGETHRLDVLVADDAFVRGGLARTAGPRALTIAP